MSVSLQDLYFIFYTFSPKCYRYYKCEWNFKKAVIQLSTSRFNLDEKNIFLKYHESVLFPK